MTEESEMKLVCEFPEGVLRTMTTVSNIDMVVTMLTNVPGVGKPFLLFNTLAGTAVAADFDLHPDWAGHGNVVTSSFANNKAMAEAMLASPPTDAVTL